MSINLNTVTYDKSLTKKITNGVKGLVSLEFNRFLYFEIPTTKK